MYQESLRDHKKKVVTDDGSVTLFSTKFGETYHSTQGGALHESLEKHVLPLFGFKPDRQKLTILDICFGLGYNTLATLYHVAKENLSTKIHIISPEFDQKLIVSLFEFDYPAEFEPFKPIIDQLSKTFFYEDEQFKIEILIGDARQILPAITTKFDAVYQDAFSPKHNPLLWTREYFAQIRSLLADDALLTTYSTAASVRLALHENGFHLFLLSNDMMRDSLIASLAMLEIEPVDMELKIQRNPSARSLRDASFCEVRR